jgi:hypothetical protein
VTFVARGGRAIIEFLRNVPKASDNAAYRSKMLAIAQAIAAQLG